MAAVRERLMRPTSPGEAAAARAADPNATVIAGGTLVVADRGVSGVAPPAYILLSAIPSLRTIASDAEGTRVGAMVTLRDLQSAAPEPMLETALRSLASPQIRNRGTLGGNIADRRPHHTLLPCLIALDARITVAAPGGSAERSASSFASHGLGAEELVESVLIPAGSAFQRFTRVAPRNGPGYAIASLALSIDTASRSVRSGLGAVGPTPLAGTAADDFLAGAIDWPAGTAPAGAAEEFGRLLGDACDPVTDDRATAAYRRHAITVMGRRLVEDWSEGAAHGR